MELNVIKLEGWGVLILQDPYQAPELARLCLLGVANGHRNPDLNGKQVRTSAIVKVENGYVVTSSGTRYDLGNPALEYEAKYPNARERLFTSLTK